MRLILVRHGLTDDNIEGILQGPVAKPLNEEGQRQAERLGRRLSIQKIDSIFSSDLSRAWATAQTISQHHPHTIPIIDRRLRERYVGDLGGRPFEDFMTAAEKEKTNSIRFRPVGGESSSDVARRAARWHEDVLRQRYGQLVVVVSHGAWLRSYLAWLFHGVVDERNRDYKHDNTGMSVIDLHESRPKLIRLNDTAHLA